MVTALLVLTCYESWNYFNRKQFEFLTTAFYLLAIFALAANIIQSTVFAVHDFHLEIKLVAGVSLNIFSRFSLLFIGFFEGASMLILWIRLRTTAEEMQGKSSEESISKA